MTREHARRRGKSSGSGGNGGTVTVTPVGTDRRDVSSIIIIHSSFASFCARSSDSAFSFSSSWLFLLAADKQTKRYTRGSSHRCSLPRVWTAKR